MTNHSTIRMSHYYEIKSLKILNAVHTKVPERRGKRTVRKTNPEVA